MWRLPYTRFFRLTTCTPTSCRSGSQGLEGLIPGPGSLFRRLTSQMKQLPELHAPVPGLATQHLASWTRPPAQIAIAKDGGAEEGPGICPLSQPRTPQANLPLGQATCGAETHPGPCLFPALGRCHVLIVPERAIGSAQSPPGHAHSSISCQACPNKAHERAAQWELTNPGCDNAHPHPAGGHPGGSEPGA